MKRIIAIALCVITVLSLVACNGATQNSTPATTPKTETPAESYAFPVMEDGKPAVYITLPESASRLVGFAREQLQSNIKEALGISVLAGTMSDREYEIHLGNTSDGAAAIIETLGEKEFAIKTDGKKLYIVAKNDAYLLDAVNYFTENIIGYNKYTERSGKNATIVKEISIVESVEADTLYHKLGGENVSLTATVEEIIRLESYSETIYRKQGGCFTGKYFFQAFISQSENEAVIGRINVETGAVRYSKPMYLGHANDIAYDLEKQEIYVGAGDSVYVFNMGTLEFKERISVAYSSGRITYCAEKNEWVLGSFTRLKKLTDETAVKKFGREDSVSSYTTQGITADGHYIYSLLCEGIGGSKYKCYVAVYDWNGSFVGKITVKIPNDYEPENISVVDGELYIGNCSGDSFTFLYKVIFE